MFETGLPFFLIFGLIGLAIRGKRALIAGGGVFLGWLGYFIYIGGDHFLERHLIGLYVLGAVFSGPLWVNLKRGNKGLVTVLGVFSLILMFVFEPVINGDPRFGYWVAKPPDPWINLGKAIAKDRDRFGVLIAGAAGKIPFFAGGIPPDYGFLLFTG